MPEPGSFRVLMPEKSMSARYSFADFRRVNRQTDAIEALRAPAVIRVGYTFNAESGELDRVLKRSEPPIPKSGDPSIAPEWTALFKKADFLSPLQSSLKL